MRAIMFMCAALLGTTPGDAQPVVQTNQGAVRGLTSSDGQVAEYKGIPFAQPPLGEGRFAPPRPPANWTGVYNATGFKHNCMQASNMGWAQPDSTQSEDCLYLNVYAPAVKPVKPVPVLFWIFGGGFQGGGGNETRLNGTWDVALQRGELIVVTHSYRLNIFGFLANDGLRPRDTHDGSTGNYGIQDQRAAMLWTSKNIASFGGDPRKVFIVGQSAGANSVSQHLVREKSWGLFSSAGMESGAFYDGVATTTPAAMKPTWDKLVKELNCSDAEGRGGEAGCVALAPMEALRKANAGCCGGWSITVDGVDLTAPGPQLAKQGKLARVPIVAGSVREDIGNTYDAVPNPGDMPKSCPPENCSEADFRAFGHGLGFDDKELKAFVAAYEGPPEDGKPAGHPGSDWYWALKHAGSDAWATCPARRLADWYTKVGQPAFWYYWTHVPDGPNGKNGAHHACEQPFVFHVLSETPAEDKEDKGNYHINASNPLEVALSKQTVAFWASMAATGAPGGGWTAHDSSENAMIFGNSAPLYAGGPAAMKLGVRKAKCDFWDTQFDKVLAMPPAERALRRASQSLPELS